MAWLDDPPLATVFRRRENDGEPVNDRRLRARVEAREVVRIAPGSFTSAKQWDALSASERHAQRVWEAAARARGPRLFSHFAAAALHGIDILGAWPELVDVSIGTASGGRSSGGMRRRGREVDTLESRAWGPHRVTTPAQTAVDLMAVLPFASGVAVADQSLWARRPGGPLASLDRVNDLAAGATGRGSTRAVRAAGFATDLSDSIRESQSRVVIAMLGFPAPELQTRFVLDGGSAASVDFFWRDRSHIGEFDGEGKYRDPRMLHGRTPHEQLMAEKDREDSLRRQVRAFSRWRTRELLHPRALYDILTAAGLTASRPRPGR